MRSRIRFVRLLCSMLCFLSMPAITSALTLQEAEERALKNSLSVQAATADVAASDAQAKAQRSLLYPRLTLEANARYISEIPKVKLVPGPQPPAPFGSHDSYSMGPTLYYTLWDQGETRKAYRGLHLLSEAKQASLQHERQRALASVRTAYARLQLALQELELVRGSLAVAETQRKDIRQRLRAGAASQLDQVNAEREVYSFQLRQVQSESDARAATFDLFALMDATAEAPARLSDLQLDEIEKTVTALMPQDLPAAEPAAESSIAANPALAAQKKAQESAEQMAESQRAAHWPKVQLQARASLDYPNGPALEQVQQNTIGVSLSMPLIDWGRTDDLVAQKRQEALAASYRRQQLANDLARDWRKGITQVGLLKEQKRIATAAAEEADRAAKLYYRSYTGGRIGLTDVQSANVRALEARVQVARVTAQLLNQVINLRALSGRDSLQ